MRLSAKSKELLYETVADISYMAGHHGYYSGDSRADMQHFIWLAKQFHKKYSSAIEANWEGFGMDYMDEIEKFAVTELKLKQKLVIGYPQGFKGLWDNLEIERCRDNGEETYPIHDDEDVEPNDFWSLYAHQIGGGVMCVADLPTEEAAIGLRDMISYAVRTFEDNGYLGLYDNKSLQAEFNKQIDAMIAKEDPKKIFRTQLEIFKNQINKLFI